MNLIEYAAALEKSSKPGDAVVARYIRAHEARIKGWLADAGRGLSRADREELTQIAMLAVVQAITAPDADAALARVHADIQRHVDRTNAWNSRRAPLPTEDNEEN